VVLAGTVAPPGMLALAGAFVTSGGRSVTRIASPFGDHQRPAHHVLEFANVSRPMYCSSAFNASAAIDFGLFAENFFKK